MRCDHKPIDPEAISWPSGEHKTTCAECGKTIWWHRKLLKWTLNPSKPKGR